MPTTQIYVPLSMKRNPIVYSSFKSARTPHQKLQIQVPLLCNKQTFVLRSGTTLSAERSRYLEDILAARFICNHRQPQLTQGQNDVH